jgi:hypothetical protein
MDNFRRETCDVRHAGSYSSGRDKRTQRKKKVLTCHVTWVDLALQLLVTPLTMDQGLGFSYKLIFIELRECHSIPQANPAM